MNGYSGNEYRPMTAEWNVYIQYVGFTDFKKRFGLPCDDKGNGFVGRLTSNIPVDDRAPIVSIRPGTSKENVLSMLSAISKAIKEHGGWEHSEPPSNVVPMRPRQDGGFSGGGDLDPEIPF